MNLDKDTHKNTRTKAGFSQATLADVVGVHWRTIQNWGKGAVIPQASILALDKVFGETNDYVPREEYDTIVSALTYATELNKRLTNNINSGIQCE